MVSKVLRTGLVFLSLIAITWPVGVTAQSSHFIIQVVGDFNAWDPYSPAMSPISSSQWADTLNVDAGCTLLKFRTDFDWDATPDYGRCSGTEGPCQVQVPVDSSNPLVDEICHVIGPNALGEIEFLVNGSYEFLLDEDTGTFSIRYLGELLPLGSMSGTVAFDDNPPVSPLVHVVAIESGTGNFVGLTESDLVDDSFSVENLPTGNYDLWFSSSGYEDLVLEGVLVTAPFDTDLGAVTLTPTPAFTQMQVMGDFNQWDPQAPFMSHPTAYVWIDTLYIEASCSFIKFRTNDIWDWDYGRCSGTEGPCQSPVPADEPLVLDVCLVIGSGNALGEVEFPESAEYEFIMDEQSFTCTIRKLGSVGLETMSWGQLKALYR